MLPEEFNFMSEIAKSAIIIHGKEVRDGRLEFSLTTNSSYSNECNVGISGRLASGEEVNLQMAISRRFRDRDTYETYSSGNIGKKTFDKTYTPVQRLDVEGYLAGGRLQLAA